MPSLLGYIRNGLQLRQATEPSSSSLPSSIARAPWGLKQKSHLVVVKTDCDISIYLPLSHMENNALAIQFRDGKFLLIWKIFPDVHNKNKKNNIWGLKLSKIIEATLAALRTKQPQWSLLGNHYSITSLQAFVSVNKRQSKGMEPFLRLFSSLMKNLIGPGLASTLGNLLPHKLHVSPRLSCLLLLSNNHPTKSSVL